LPDAAQGDKPARKQFKPYPIAYFHIDIAEVQTAEGRLYLFVGMDRTSQFACVQVHPQAGKAAEFLRDLQQAIPYISLLREQCDCTA
jgi:hypothetical protein